MRTKPRNRLPVQLVGHRAIHQPPIDRLGCQLGDVATAIVDYGGVALRCAVESRVVLHQYSAVVVAHDFDGDTKLAAIAEEPLGDETAAEPAPD